MHSRANRQDAFTLAALRSTTPSSRPESFEVAKLLGEVRRDLAAAAALRGVWLETDCGAELAKLAVTGDSRRLRDVLLHLGANAIRYTREGGVCLSAKLLAQDETDARLRFEVSDTGVGIAPDVLANLFETTTAIRRGAQAIPARIHLAACRRLIHLLGGRIGAESTVGQGTTFWIEVTLRLAPTEALGVTPLARGTVAAATVTSVTPSKSQVIDRNIGLKYAAGRADLYDRVLVRFRELHSTDAAALARALRSEDRKTAHRLLHSLKGVAAMIGALALRDEAARLEARYLAGATNDDLAGDLAGIEAQLVEVAAAIDVLRMDLQHELEPRH